MNSNVNVGTAANASIAGRDIHIHHNVSNQSRLSQNFDELGKKLGWMIHIHNKVDLSESPTYCAMRRDSTWIHQAVIMKTLRRNIQPKRRLEKLSISLKRCKIDRNKCDVGYRKSTQANLSKVYNEHILK